MRILITGGAGQLARDLRTEFRQDHVVVLDRCGLDITEPSSVAEALGRHAPDALLNTAAFHEVDRCERAPELALAVNAAAVRRLAAACHEAAVLFVHFSTDYVFGGTKRTPYEERDAVDPVNVYGASKAAGEMLIRATTARHLIIRTSGLYGIGGLKTSRGNFVETMLRLGSTGSQLQVVCDQVLTPTYTRHLASTVRALVHGQYTGTFHVTDSGQCSWYEFAEAIFDQAGMRVDLVPASQADRPVPARRPSYSVLAHAELLRCGFPEQPDWREGLQRYLEERRTAAGTW